MVEANPNSPPAIVCNVIWAPPQPYQLSPIPPLLLLPFAFSFAFFFFPYSSSVLLFFLHSAVFLYKLLGFFLSKRIFRLVLKSEVFKVDDNLKEIRITCFSFSLKRK